MVSLRIIFCIVFLIIQETISLGTVNNEMSVDSNNIAIGTVAIEDSETISRDARARPVTDDGTVTKAETPSASAGGGTGDSAPAGKCGLKCRQSSNGQIGHPPVYRPSLRDDDSSSSSYSDSDSSSMSLEDIPIAFRRGTARFVGRHTHGGGKQFHGLPTVTRNSFDKLRVPISKSKKKKRG